MTYTKMLFFVHRNTLISYRLRDSQGRFSDFLSVRQSSLAGYYDRFSQPYARSELPEGEHISSIFNCMYSGTASERSMSIQGQTNYLFGILLF
jgi:hypothetical protein